MTKIPVLEAIRFAYRFTFHHLGAIIGLIWLPMIMATVIGFFVFQRFFAALANALASNNFASMGPARALYRDLGFVAVAPYYDNPLPGVMGMALALELGE